MIFIGVTGGIGAGKSEVLRLLKSRGAAVLSADKVAHRLLSRPVIRRKLVRRFGREILGPRGGIVRALLAKAAFKTKATQGALNKILHPPIRDEINRWRRRQASRSRPPRWAVVEVPLLHEEGWAGLFDGVLSVHASEKTRVQRLGKRGWSDKETRRRHRLQWSSARKNRLSDWVLMNDGSRDLLARRVSDWLRALPSKRGDA